MVAFSLMRIAVTRFSAAVLALTTALGPAGSQPFSLQISAVHQRVQSGSDVQVKLTLTNTSDGQITIVDIDRWCDYSLEVRDGQGQPVPETAYKRELNSDWLLNWKKPYTAQVAQASRYSSGRHYR